MDKPPFSVSARAINLIAGISALIERCAIRMEQADALLLRKANRIKTIHSSLAIEGNELTESQVSDLLEGKRVVAPLRQIREAKNAIRAYEIYPSLDPFSVEDLLKAHGIMMEALSDDAGRFRRGNVGVFAGTQAIHIAPPAERVPHLIENLFQWLKNAEDHYLIRSCVFHYEFEFIHPFSDGNGRMGRLWQSLILGKLHKLFEHLPVENIVHANQQAYYDAINASTEAGDCGAFIDFMLREIFEALSKAAQKSGRNVGVNVGANVGVSVGVSVGVNEKKLLKILKSCGGATAKNLAEGLGLSSRQVERLLKSLREKGIIRRVGSDKSGHWEFL